MLLAMALLLMVQLQSFGKLLLVVSVAPLGLIGVVAALLPSGAPLGFVAILGILALIGIIIRNSVILVTQIDEYLADGRAPWDAVVEATCHRMRPILLTAAAASLGMVPIAREVFWGPMAYRDDRRHPRRHLLTLIFLPALYVAAYRIKPPPRRVVSSRRSAPDTGLTGREKPRAVDTAGAGLAEDGVGKRRSRLPSALDARTEEPVAADAQLSAIRVPQAIGVPRPNRTCA